MTSLLKANECSSIKPLEQMEELYDEIQKDQEQQQP